MRAFIFFEDRPIGMTRLDDEKMSRMIDEEKLPDGDTFEDAIKRTFLRELFDKAKKENPVALLVAVKFYPMTTEEIIKKMTVKIDIFNT